MGAMVAITGCVLHNADVEFPGYLSLSQQLKFSDIPNGGQGIFNIPAAGVAQILLFCGLVEMAWWPASKYDGDYNVGFFGEKLSPEKKTEAERRDGQRPARDARHLRQHGRRGPDGPDARRADGRGQHDPVLDCVLGLSDRRMRGGAKSNLI